ncbi:MAG: hypothetical protein ACHQE5_05305 [Actinomycetes bacterium]
MAGNQFGGSGGADDRFGYYAATVTRPTAAIGAPAGAQVGAFGSPYQSSPAVERERSGALWVALLVVIVLLIGAVVGFGWWKHHDRLVVPEQLGGMQLNTTAQAGQAMDAAVAHASDRAGSNNKIAGGFYGNSLTDPTVLLVSRGPNVSAAQPPPSGQAGVQAYGPDLCQSTGKLVTCVRVRGDLAVVVMAYRKAVPVPPAVVAGWADEAWAAQ